MDESRDMKRFAEKCYETVWDGFAKEDLNKYNEWMEEHMADFFEIAKFFGVHSVLEGACGPGFNLKLIEDEGFMATGLDVNLNPSRRANIGNVSLIEGDLEDMRSVSNFSFDACVALGIVHSLDDAAVVSEMGRVSKKVVFIGVYGTKDPLYMVAEPVIRWCVRRVPYRICEGLMVAAGFSKFRRWLLLDWAFMPKLKRYTEREVQELFGDNYHCFIKRYGAWINCIAVKRSCFE